MKTHNSLFNKAPILMLLLAALFLAASAQGAKHLVYAEWFIDTDPGQGNGTQITLPCDGVWDETGEEFCVSNIATPNLPDGRHTFFLRMGDSNNQWGMRRMDFFIVPEPAGGTKTITAAEYKIDLAGSWQPLPAADGSYDEAIEYLIANTIGSGDLSVGQHTLYARVQDNYNIWSIERQVPFQVLEASPYKKIMAAEYFIDTDPGHGNGNELLPDDAAFDSCSESAHLDGVSTASLSVGDHWVYARFKDNYVAKFDGWGPTERRLLVVEDSLFHVVAPNGGETWVNLHQGKVIWTKPSGVVDSTEMYLSLNGGGSYPLYVGTVIGQDTTFNWLIPTKWSDSCRIQVKAYSSGQPALASSAANFSLHSIGDVNCDVQVDVSDVICLVCYIFQCDGPCASPCRLQASDVNCDGTVNLSDAVYLVNVVFLDWVPCPEADPLAKAASSGAVAMSAAFASGSQQTVALTCSHDMPLAAVELDVEIPPTNVAGCQLAKEYPGFQLFWRKLTESSIKIGVIDLTGQNALPPGKSDLITISLNEPLSPTVKMNLQGIAVDNNAQSHAVKAELFAANAESQSLPKSYALSQNFPNPFNPTTTIWYALPSASFVEVSVLNVLGQKVRTLVSEYLTAGCQSVEWNGHDDAGKEVSSGVYFYRIAAGNFTDTKKMVLMK